MLLPTFLVLKEVDNTKFIGPRELNRVPDGRKRLLINEVDRTLAE